MKKGNKITHFFSNVDPKIKHLDTAAELPGDSDFSHNTTTPITPLDSSGTASNHQSSETITSICSVNEQIVNDTQDDHRATGYIKLTTPHHPPSSDIPCTYRVVNNKKLKVTFQSKWFTKYEWLHYDDTHKNVKCFPCNKAVQLDLMKLSRHTIHSAFIGSGFTN